MFCFDFEGLNEIEMGKRGAKDNQICSHFSLSQFSFEPFLPFKKQHLYHTLDSPWSSCFSFNVIFLDKIEQKLKLRILDRLYCERRKYNKEKCHVVKSPIELSLMSKLGKCVFWKVNGHVSQLFNCSSRKQTKYFG